MPRNSLDHGASPSRAHLLESQLTTPTSDIASLSPKTIDLEGRESPSEQHEPVAGFASCSINLLKTILGAGMLAMPFAFASLGYIPGTVFVLVTAALAAFGLHLFIASSKYVGRGATVNKLANLTYPSLTILFDFAIALKCFGVAISYLIVIGDMMPSIINGLGIRNSLFLSRQFWLMLSAIPLVPLAFLKRMDSLKYTSFAGLLSVLYLVGVAAWNVWKPDAIRPPPDAGIEPFASFSFASIKSFSVFIFPIQREAKDSSSTFMNRVIGFCVFSSAILYLLFSIISYANFGRLVQGNVFLNYPLDKVEMIIARILFAILAAFSYPLQTLPCRNSLEHLLPISSATKKQNSKLLHISLTVLILVGSFTVAFLQRSLVLISGIIGTIAGIPICYILPFLFYYKLTEGAGWTWRRIGAAFLAAFGLVAMVISAASIFFTIFYTPTLNVVGNYIL